MKALWRCVTGILFVLVLSGCQGAEDKSDGARAKCERLTADTPGQAADGRWVLKQMVIAGRDYSLTAKLPTIQIDQEGKVSGFSSVNRYFGKMDIDDRGSITWSPLGSTRMAGPEDLMQQEDAFLKALAKTTQGQRKEKHLILQNKEGLTILVFELIK